MTKKTNHEYPAIIALARKAQEYGKKDDDCLWQIGEALVKDCGEVGKDGVNNEVAQKSCSPLPRNWNRKAWVTVFRIRLSQEAAQNGCTRFRLLIGSQASTWAVHDLAGNPATLRRNAGESEGVKTSA